MSALLDLLQKRRSIRRYQDKAIEPELLQQILQSALLAPSSKSTRPWEFIIIEDKAILNQLPACRKPAMTWLKDAAAAIVVIADESKIDVWVEDCSIAAVLMQLEAADLGLGSCWVQLRNRQAFDDTSSEDYMKNLLHIPDGYKTEAIIALGYPAEEKKAVALDKLNYDKLHYNDFNKSYTVERR